MMTPVEHSPGHIPSLKGLERVGPVCLPLNYPSALPECYPEIISQVEGYLKCYIPSTMRWQKTGQRLEHFAVDMVILAQSAVLTHTQ